jgi:putative transposase
MKPTNPTQENPMHDTKRVSEAPAELDSLESSVLESSAGASLSRVEQRVGEAPAERVIESSVLESSAGASLSRVGFYARRRPAHGVLVIPSQTTIVFLTVCCKKRSPWLATAAHHQLLREIWADQSCWSVGQYVLMPEHLHLVAAMASERVPLDNWVRYFKSQFTKRNRNPSCVWQTDHWDTRVRSVTHLEERIGYMQQNPVERGLSTRADDWPYQGRVHPWGW